MVNQRFNAFPAPIMEHVLAHPNLKPEHFLKLYQCAKIFYDDYGFNIIRHLEIVDDGQSQILDPFKSVICISNPALLELEDFWISDSFTYNAPSNLTTMFEFSHCTVKKLIACNYLMLEEFVALTESGTIKELKIGYVVNVEDKKISLDKIISYVPNATSIELSESIVSPTTIAALKSLDHKAKISHFVLRNINDHLLGAKPETLINFLLKNAAADCNVHIDYKFEEGESDLHRQLNNHLEHLAEVFNGHIKGLLKLEQEKKELELQIAAIENSIHAYVS